MQVVHAYNFETFDPFAAGLHADPNWYNARGKDAQHSDVLSDMVVHMLLNQICTKYAAQPNLWKRRARPSGRGPPPRPCALCLLR